MKVLFTFIVAQPLQRCRSWDFVIFASSYVLRRLSVRFDFRSSTQTKWYRFQGVRTKITKKNRAFKYCNVIGWFVVHRIGSPNFVGRMLDNAAPQFWRKMNFKSEMPIQWLDIFGIVVGTVYVQNVYKSNFREWHFWKEWLLFYACTDPTK